MPPLAIHVEELIAALEHHGYDAKYIFDCETGEVVFMPDPDAVGDDMIDEELSDAIEEGCDERLHRNDSG